MEDSVYMLSNCWPPLNASSSRTGQCINDSFMYFSGDPNLLCPFSLIIFLWDPMTIFLSKSCYREFGRTVYQYLLHKVHLSFFSNISIKYVSDKIEYMTELIVVSIYLVLQITNYIHIYISKILPNINIFCCLALQARS